MFVLADCRGVLLLLSRACMFSDTVSVGSDGSLSLGKRLTWRRSQHGLVGWEMSVNSGPFSQLPAETNTNDYPVIVSKEATRHL